MAFLPAENLLPKTLTAQEATRCKLAFEGLRIAIGHDLHWVEVFAELHWPHDTALVCDNNTWKALGQKLSEALTGADYRITLVNLGSAPKPDMGMVEYICGASANCKAIIAVGSGTINDLVKLSAHRLQKPYAVCGTAPSMNGYLSTNAAIMIEGHKQSLKAALPCAALFDLNVLQSAPDRLTHAGIGDSACRSTAQADWLLSHHLLNTPYDPLPFKLLAPYEADMFKGNAEALITTLLLSGLGMTLCGGSYPASQGEHLVAHYMEMRFPETSHKTLHGEQIAVTTLFMSALQHGLLGLPGVPQWIASSLPDRTYCLKHFGAETGESVWKEWSAKLEAIGNRKQFNERLANNWPEIRMDIARVIIPPSTIERALNQVHAPLSVLDLGWDVEQFTAAAHNAYLIRNRFTFLDLGMMVKEEASP